MQTWTVFAMKKQTKPYRLYQHFKFHRNKKQK
jgi:hypothetical protein